MSNRVMVLGATGFIGSRLVQELGRNGFDVGPLTLQRAPVNRLAPFGFAEESISANLQQGDTLVSCLPSTSPIQELDSSLFDSVTFLRWLVEVADRRGVQRIAYCSSGGAVYGNPDYLPIKETHVARPISAYGKSKVESEEALIRDCDFRGISLTIWRFSNLFGGGQRASNGQGLIAHLQEAAKWGLKLKVFGSGEMVRDYLHVAEAAKAAMLTLSGNPSHVIYNIGSGTGRSINEIIDAFQSIMRQQVEVEHIPSPTSFVETNILSIDRIKNEFPSFFPPSAETGIAGLFFELAQ